MVTGILPLVYKWWSVVVPSTVLHQSTCLANIRGGMDNLLLVDVLNQQNSCYHLLLYVQKVCLLWNLSRWIIKAILCFSKYLCQPLTKSCQFSHSYLNNLYFLIKVYSPPILSTSWGAPVRSCPCVGWNMGMAISIEFGTCSLILPLIRA